MLRFAPALLLLFAACSDMGPRDRSLLARAGTFPLHREVFREKRPVRPVAQPSVIGLAADPLAPLYSEKASLVVRCADVTTLASEFQPHVDTLRRLLPELGLPLHPPATLLRAKLGLPESVEIDRERPFAFVRTPSGWVALVPITDDLPGGSAARMVDAHYCLVGGAEAVKAYEPGFRTGFHLPGDVSVLARGEHCRNLGPELQAAAGFAGVELPAIPKLDGMAAKQIRRIDVSLRFLEGRTRVDVRLAPDRSARSGLAERIAAVQPRAGTALRWLPGGATIEATGGADMLSCLDVGAALGIGDGDAKLLEGVLGPLGDDVAFQLHLRGERPGVAMLVAELTAPDVAAAERFLDGHGLVQLLRAAAGEGGHLEYAPEAFVRDGVAVGTITGYFGTAALERLRARGPAAATMAEYLRGPAVVYVALAGRRLCVVAGERARDDMEALLDCITGGTPRRAHGACPADSLLGERLFGARVDLAALLRGSRDAARHWHTNGDRLRKMPFEEELMLDVAASVEGGALRFAVQFPDAPLAAVAARIRDALR
jgi:hypothetical protein